MKTLRRMLCLVDGEHYFPVTKSALDMLDSLEHNEVVAVVFIGGTEKLRDSSEEGIAEKLGRPVYFGDRSLQNTLSKNCRYSKGVQSRCCYGSLRRTNC